MTERDVLAARLQAALARDQMGTLAAVCRERYRVLGDDPSTPDYRPSTITGR